MWSFSKTLLICWLTCSLAGGCATTQTASPAQVRAPERSDAPAEEEPELPAPAGWPEYYPPRLVRDLSAVDEVTGEPASISRGYVFHRIDVEKVRVLRARENRCSTDLSACERRVAELTATPGFWNRWEGRVLLIGLGFIAGTATTVGIVVGVNQ